MPKHSPILQAVWQHADEMPNKTALVWNDSPVTYAELRTNVNRAAAYLVSQGVKPGDCLGISAKKGLEFVYIYLGGQLLGATNVVLDPEANEKRLDYIKSITKPTLIVDCAEVEKVGGENRWTEDDKIPLSTSTSDFDLSPDSPAEIVFTTGTTGAA